MKPAHVLYYEAINDVSRFPLPPDYVAITEENLFSESLASYFSKVRPPQDFFSKLLLAHFLADAFSKDKGKDAGTDGLSDEQRVALETYALIANGQRFLNNVSTLARICQGFGTQLILVTFLHDPEKMDPYASRSLQYYNRLLREFAERANLPLVDLEKVFEPVPEKASYFFEDHYHPTPKGADYIAFSIAEFFAQNLEPLLSQ